MIFAMPSLDSLLKKYGVTDSRDLPWVDIWLLASIRHKKEHPIHIKDCYYCEQIKYLPRKVTSKVPIVKKEYRFMNGRTRVGHKLLNGVKLEFKSENEW